MKNGFLGAIYDGFEATVDTLVDTVRGRATWEALDRVDEREDRAVLCAGYHPDFVTEPRQYWHEQERAAHRHGLSFEKLREIGGWRRDDLESVLERYDEIDVHDLYHDGARPEDFGYESVPAFDDFLDSRGAPSFVLPCSSEALSLTPHVPDGACSLAEPEPTSDAPDLGDAFPALRSRS